MDDEQLRNIGNARKRPQRTARLGDVVRQLMERQILPRQAKFEPVVQLWNQLLPEELRRHCEIVDFSSGQLKVRVDSPSHASELRWCSSQLLDEIQDQCPRAKLKEIKVVIASND